jgi:hypothetical protein
VLVVFDDTPETTSSFLYFFEASVHGFGFKALIERETLPSLISIIFTLIFDRL